MNEVCGDWNLSFNNGVAIYSGNHNAHCVLQQNIVTGDSPNASGAGTRCTEEASQSTLGEGQTSEARNPWTPDDGCLPESSDMESLNLSVTSNSDNCSTLKFATDLAAPIVENFANFDTIPAKESARHVKKPLSNTWKPKDLVSVPSPIELDIVCFFVFLLHNIGEYGLANMIKKDIVEYMKSQDITVTVQLFGDLNWITNDMDRLEFGMKRGAYTFILTTDTFVKVAYDRFKASTLLCSTIRSETKQYTIVPIYINKFNTDFLPFSCLSGIIFPMSSEREVDKSLYHSSLDSVLGPGNPNLPQLIDWNDECLKAKRWEWITAAHKKKAEEKQQEEQIRQHDIALRECRAKEEQRMRIMEDILGATEDEIASKENIMGDRKKEIMSKESGDLKEPQRFRTTENISSGNEKSYSVEYILNNLSGVGGSTAKTADVENSGPARGTRNQSQDEVCKHGRHQAGDLNDKSRLCTCKSTTHTQQSRPIHITNLNVIQSSTVSFGSISETYELDDAEAVMHNESSAENIRVFVDPPTPVDPVMEAPVHGVLAEFDSNCTINAEP